ncbi:hypothetical protein ABVK25_005537 [Lepraria finkii]|uniref:Uncharacterized protein n=1 Tax=Lepraria finkii TaxID=1340010 RepID=A0ABR4B809_9LECA
MLPAQPTLLSSNNTNANPTTLFDLSSPDSLPIAPYYYDLSGTTLLLRLRDFWLPIPRNDTDELSYKASSDAVMVHDKANVPMGPDGYLWSISVLGREELELRFGAGVWMTQDM